MKLTPFRRYLWRNKRFRFHCRSTPPQGPIARGSHTTGNVGFYARCSYADSSFVLLFLNTGILQYSQGIRSKEVTTLEYQIGHFTLTLWHPLVIHSFPLFSGPRLVKYTCNKPTNDEGHLYIIVFVGSFNICLIVEQLICFHSFLLVFSIG